MAKLGNIYGKVKTKRKKFTEWKKKKESPADSLRLWKFAVKSRIGQFFMQLKSDLGIRWISL